MARREANAESLEVPAAAVVSLKPGQCRGYLRREAARAFPAVVGGFLEQAKAGSCQHLRFLTEMFEETRPKRRVRVEKGLAERMVEEWLE